MCCLHVPFFWLGADQTALICSETEGASGSASDAAMQVLKEAWSHKENRQPPVLL